eukprot:TRINITY_DN2143_c0_g3_i1.p3 TRINITY_DN2143_c0_g3~~TRINITY_DN2143_c0_g3_i1.p3  ORF type:complete len:225 (+),score=4.63 TRINITY_DN2143_c0_g3_i1:679-1353(+)
MISISKVPRNLHTHTQIQDILSVVLSLQLKQIKVSQIYILIFLPKTFYLYNLPLKQQNTEMLQHENQRDVRVVVLLSPQIAKNKILPLNVTCVQQNNTQNYWLAYSFAPKFSQQVGSTSTTTTADLLRQLVTKSFLSPTTSSYWFVFSHFSAHRSPLLLLVTPQTGSYQPATSQGNDKQVSTKQVAYMLFAYGRGLLWIPSAVGSKLCYMSTQNKVLRIIITES